MAITHPYIKHNRRTNSYSVYAQIDDKRKVIGTYTSEIKALEVLDQARDGTINTTKYPNYSGQSNE